MFSIFKNVIKLFSVDAVDEDINVQKNETDIDQNQKRVRFEKYAKK